MSSSLTAKVADWVEPSSNGFEKEAFTTDYELIAVGTNALATAQMLKRGLMAAQLESQRSSGICDRADIIIAESIIAADPCWELSPAMATAIGSSRASKILIPINKCRLQVAGAPEDNLPCGWTRQSN